MMLGQIHLMSVYVADDDYSVAINDEPMPCRFCHATLGTQLQNLPVRERSESLATRRLQYPADFVMPDNARVVWWGDPTAGGFDTLWNCMEDTPGAWHGPSGAVTVNTVQVHKISALH